PSLAAGGGVQGILASEGEMPRGACRHRREQGHVAVPRRAAARRARADGRGFLVLRARAEPQGAGDVPAPSPCAGALEPARCAGRAVPSLDAGEFRDLTPVAWRAVRRAYFFSVPRSIAAVATAE